MLADLGAEVIKVEVPWGEPYRHSSPRLVGLDHDFAVSPPFQMDNRGKRSLALDLALPGALEALEKLIDGADVLLTNMLPERLAKFGLTPEELRADRPRLIVGRLSGYGDRGPRANDLAYDHTAFWAATGLLDTMRDPGAPPAFMRPGIGDHTSGMALAAGVLAALRARDRSGEGQVVEVALEQVARYVNGNDASYAALTGEAPPPHDRSAPPNPLWNLYRCGDGRWLFLVMLDADRFWPRLLAAIARPEVAEDARFGTGLDRHQNARELVAILDEVFAGATLAEWTERLDRAGVVWEPVRTLVEAVQAANATQSGFLPEAEHPEHGAYRTIRPPFSLSGHSMPAPPRRRASPRTPRSCSPRLAATRRRSASSSPRPTRGPRRHRFTTGARVAPFVDWRASRAPHDAGSVRRRRPVMTAPLENIRVVEIANFVAVPAAGALLADLGAEVIKVEVPWGEIYRHNTPRMAGVDHDFGASPPFQMDNRGKRSLALDLALPAAQAALQRVIATADVITTNLLPERLEKYGLAPEKLRAERSELIIGRLSGYGDEGNRANDPAFDYTAFWALSGLMDTMRDPESPPAFMRPGVGDHSAAMALVTGVLAALRVRDRTGAGQVVDVALQQIGYYINGNDASYAALAGSAPPRHERDAPRNPLWNHYRCGDGRWLFLVMIDSDRYWPLLAAAIGRPELAEDERFANGFGRLQNNRALVSLLDEVFAGAPLSEWTTRLDGARLIWAPVRTLVEAADDENARQSGFLPTAEHPEHGAFRTIAPPLKMSGHAMTGAHAAPELAADTANVLAEAGVDDETIALLLASAS